MSRSKGEVVVVVDPGSSSIKVGYGGDDIPTSIFPSTLNKSNLKLESLEALDGDPADFPIHRGIVRDFDQMEDLWGMIIEEAGLANMENMSIMLVESAKSNPEQREKWAELLFAKFNVPSICIGNSASLTMFAAGRTTGVAVECGAGLTSSVPVFEGLALSHAMLTMDYAGQDISQALRLNMSGENGYQFDALEIKQLKERMAFVHPNLRSEQQQLLQQQQHLRDERVSVSLPDGNEVSISKAAFSDSVERLFHNDRISPVGGLVGQVHESLTLCDESIRRDLMNNIAIAGGSSLLPGFGDRLSRELSLKFAGSPDKHQQYGIRVLPSSSFREPGYTLQRKIAPWIGGSIIGSLDSYSELKITRQEWEEGLDTSVWQTKCF